MIFMVFPSNVIHKNQTKDIKILAGFAKSKIRSSPLMKSKLLYYGPSKEGESGEAYFTSISTLRLACCSSQFCGLG